jgi:hypothetical protein
MSNWINAHIPLVKQLGDNLINQPASPSVTEVTPNSIKPATWGGCQINRRFGKPILALADASGVLPRSLPRTSWWFIDKDTASTHHDSQVPTNQGLVAPRGLEGWMERAN